MPFNFGDIPLILQELRRYFASKAQGTLADSALQPGAIGSTVQAYHARLDSLSGITNADGGIEKTGANTYGRYALTAFGKSLVDDADASTARSTLGLTIGSNVQAWDADLDAIAAISTSGPIERTGPGTWTVSDRVRLFGGNGSDGDFATGVVGTINTTGATDVTLSRETYYFNNFTISSGHSVTLSAGVTYIYCSGTVSIGGTMTVNAAVAGGRNVHEGGSGASGQEYTNSFSGLGIGTSRGQTYNWLIQPYGSSGSGPNFVLFGTGQIATFTGGTGGAGGGSVFIQAAGAILVTSTGSINAVGGSAATASVTNAFLAIGGSGGGSGGLAHLSSLTSVTTNAGSVINVSGGNGAAGQKGASVPEIIPGGGAGGGGWIVVIAPSIATNGTTNVAPGANGANTAGTTFTWRSNAGASFAGLGGNGVINASPPAATSGQLVTRLIKPVA